MLVGSLNSIEEGVVMINSKHIIVMTNTAAKKLFDVQEMIGWRVEDLFKGKEELLTAYSNILYKKESQVLNTNLKSALCDKLISAKCRFIMVNVTEGTSGDILLIIQPRN